MLSRIRRAFRMMLILEIASLEQLAELAFIGLWNSWIRFECKKQVEKRMHFKQESLWNGPRKK